MLLCTCVCQSENTDVHVSVKMEAFSRTDLTDLATPYSSQ